MRQDKMSGSVSFLDSDFRSSSFSNVDPVPFCVQVAIKPEGVAVRDSEDSKKVTLHFTPERWQAFIDGVKAGEFDI